MKFVRVTDEDGDQMLVNSQHIFSLSRLKGEMWTKVVTLLPKDWSVLLVCETPDEILRQIEVGG